MQATALSESCNRDVFRPHLLKAVLQHGDLIRSLSSKYLNELHDVLLEDYNKTAWKFTYRPEEASKTKLLQIAR